MGQIISSLNNNNNDEDLYDNLSKLQAKLDNENIQKDVLNKLNQELESKILHIKETNNIEITKLLNDNKFEKDDLINKYELEKKEKDDLINKYELERKEKDDLINKYELERKEKDDLINKYELEKKEKNDLINKYELERKEKELNNLNLLKEFKIEKTNIINENKKNIKILENKLKLCEEENLNLKKINKKQEIDIKGKLEGINNMISYYKTNSEQIVNFILDKNNNIIPDYFEKDIVTNTYNSLIDMIYENMKKIK